MKLVYGPNFKMHILLSETIVPSLTKSLQNRFGEVFISDEQPMFVSDGTAIWDPGGSILGNDIKFSLKLSDGFSLLCRSQHWVMFKNVVLDAVKNKGEESYLKMHSQLYCLCLTEDESIRLMDQIMKNSCRFDPVAEVTMNRIPELPRR